MTKHLLGTGAAIAILASAAGISSASADAVMIGVSAPLTGTTAAVAAPVAIVLHEAVQGLNGTRAFGPNGAILKAFSAVVKIGQGNVRAAGRENGALAEAVRATSGVSIRDIKKHGLFGGSNSIFRKPFG